MLSKALSLMTALMKFEGSSGLPILNEFTSLELISKITYMIKIALFLTYDYSIQTWHDTGTLEKELKMKH